MTKSTFEEMCDAVLAVAEKRGVGGVELAAALGIMSETAMVQAVHDYRSARRVHFEMETGRAEFTGGARASFRRHGRELPPENGS